MSCFMALDHSCQVQRHSHAERGLDFYETPPCAVEALLRAESVPLDVWEPAAGRGAIVNVLRDRGHTVIASDIVDRGFRLHFCRDFLAEIGMPAGVECILTNPPFKWAEELRARARTVPACDHAAPTRVPRVRAPLRNP
jgi:hypothetical protein